MRTLGFLAVSISRINKPYQLKFAHPVPTSIEALMAIGCCASATI